MPLNPNRQRIEIAYSVTPGEVPTGLEPGELGINVTNPARVWIGLPSTVDLLELSLASYAPSVGWTAGTNPNDVSFFVNTTGRVLNITRISGVVERRNGGAAEVTVVKAANGTMIGFGIPLHGAPFNLNLLGSEGVVEDITPTAGLTLEVGERLGLQASAASSWEASVASITVYLE